VRQHVDAELVIVGGGDPAELGPEVAAALQRGVDDGHVRAPGEVPFGRELFQHFADADVFVLPSRTEGTPRVLVEARAFGCPVVATAVGGIPTSVTDGVDGLLVPPEDPVALADALRRVLEDEGLRERLGTEARQRAASTTVEAFAAMLAEEIAAVAAEGSGSAAPPAKSRNAEDAAAGTGDR
jgi:glycosyltransferase involved in cell wall biosynthesis